MLDEVQDQIMAGNFNADQSGPSGPGYLPWLDGYGFSTNPADYPIVDVTDGGIGNGTVNSGDPTLHQLGNLANPSRLAFLSRPVSHVRMIPGEPRLGWNLDFFFWLWPPPPPPLL